MRLLKISYVRFALLLVLPLVVIEPTYREVYRAWKNLYLLGAVKRQWANWVSYWRNPLDHI